MAEARGSKEGGRRGTLPEIRASSQGEPRESPIRGDGLVTSA